MKIQLTTEESEEMFYDALCNAVGTGYMQNYGLEINYNKDDYAAAKSKLIDPCWEEVLMQILRDGKTLSFKDREDNDELHSITLTDVHERVQNTPVSHLLAAIEENGDVITADVILQTVFFNDIVFG
jgi:hypothetical protein